MNTNALRLVKSFIFVSSVLLMLAPDKTGDNSSIVRSFGWVEDIVASDDKLTPYVNFFYSEKRKHLPPDYGRKVASVKFGPTEGREMGFCLYYDAHLWLFKYDLSESILKTQYVFSIRWKQREIVVNEKVWRFSTEQTKRLLITHEMAHCHLNLNHFEEFAEDGFPRSIMYPTLVSSGRDVDAINEQIYIDTAFNIKGPQIEDGDLKTSGYQR